MISPPINGAQQLNMPQKGVITVNRAMHVSHMLPAYNTYSSVNCTSDSHTSFPSLPMRRKRFCGLPPVSHPISQRLASQNLTPGFSELGDAGGLPQEDLRRRSAWVGWGPGKRSPKEEGKVGMRRGAGPELGSLARGLSSITRPHRLPFSKPTCAPGTHSRASACSAKFAEHLLCTSPDFETPDSCFLHCVRPGSPAPHLRGGREGRGREKRRAERE